MKEAHIEKKYGQGKQVPDMSRLAVAAQTDWQDQKKAKALPEGRKKIKKSRGSGQEIKFKFMRSCTANI